MNEIKKPYVKASCCHNPDCDLYDPETCWGQVALVAMNATKSYHRCENKDHDYKGD